MAPKPTMSELRADAAADAMMEGAVEAQTEAQLMQSYPKAMPEKPAGTILRDAMDAVKSTIAAGVRPISPRAVPPGSSKDVDAMSDGSFEKVEDDVVMVTEADYDLAEKVATHTRMMRTPRLWNWLARPLRISPFWRRPPTWMCRSLLRIWRRPFPSCPLRILRRLRCRRNPVPSPGQPKATKGRGASLRIPLWSSTAPRMAPTRSPTRRQTCLWYLAKWEASCGTSPLGSSMTWCPSSKGPPLSRSQPSIEFWRSTPCRWWSSNTPTFWRPTMSGREMPRWCTNWTQASCKAPWIHQAMEGKCLGCGQTSSAIPALEATGLQLTVDGVQWTLKAGAKGSVWLPEEGQGISSEQLKALKRDATINAGDMVTKLPLARVESEPTYSDSVPPGQRLTLRETVTTNELLDDAQFHGLELGDRPPVRSDFKDGQQALFFHPQAAKALRLQLQLKEAPPAGKETVEQKMAKEEASLQTIAAMQEGAHEVPQSEARGAAVLRHLDMGKFEGYLKRKYEAPESSRDTWSQLSMAQTSLANRKWQEEHRGRTFALKPLPDINLWTPRVQEILQSGSLCEAQLDYMLPSQPAWTSRSWSRTKATHVLALCSWSNCPRRSGTSLKTGTLAQGREAFPSVAKKFSKDSEERKVAILDIINAHEGKSVRIWGGQWRKKWTTMEIPSWAQEAKPGTVGKVHKALWTGWWLPWVLPFHGGGVGRPGQAWHTPSGGHHREDVLGPGRSRMALAPWSDFLELCCLGSALGPRGDPQRNLRHLAANAACSPAPLARPEEQGEDACRAEGLQECHQRGQFLLQRVGHQVLAAPGCWLISAGVSRDGEIPCCPNVPHALPCHRHGPPHSGHPRLQSPPSGESNLRWEDQPAALCL